MTQAAHDAKQLIQQQAPGFSPKIAIILGSGLGHIAEQIEPIAVISYQQLPGFPISTVSGHDGQLLLGELNGVPVACLQGRAHFYEGISTEQVKTPLRTLKLLGCEYLLATNAAGSLRPDIQPGELVVIRDHINFQGNNPLVGPNDAEFGPRFIGMENAYDANLREKLQSIGNNLQIPLQEGVYIGVLGPSFETPAEIQAFRLLGADVVGMSTIAEVIVARHCGLRVLAISAVTNMGAGMSNITLSHETTLSGAKLAVDKLSRLLLQFIHELA